MHIIDGGVDRVALIRPTDHIEPFTARLGFVFVNPRQVPDLVRGDETVDTRPRRVINQGAGWGSLA